MRWMYYKQVRAAGDGESGDKYYYYQGKKMIIMSRDRLGVEERKRWVHHMVVIGWFWCLAGWEQALVVKSRVLYFE